MNKLLKAIRPTTFIKSEKLSTFLGVDLTIATETFQHTGSYKFRGAFNTALNVEQDHLITSSSGNFGQALAFACKLLGKKCHIVMPDNSVKVKIESVRNYGAMVDLIDVNKVGRDERVSQLCEEFPEAFRASPFNDELVIDGNSTLGDEISDYEENFDYVISPIGGGGLISGISKGLCRKGDASMLLGAEPLMGNDAARSLREGRIIRNENEPQTLADGARTIAIGELNWEIIKDGVADIIEVSEESIKEALRLYFVLANLKVEPTGTLSLAGVLEQKEKFADKKVCVVVSGGNVDPELYRQILVE